ncbi:MAG: SBBP repeat-containing protein, partial [Thermoplasmata archaeon]
MTKKGTKTKAMVIVSISFLLAVHIIHLPDTRMESAQSDFINDLPGNTGHTTEAETGDNEPIFDFPDMEAGHFTENLGQWGEHIQFLARTSFGYIGVSNDGVFYYVLSDEGGHIVKVSFQDAGKVRPLGREDAGFSSNYFYGNDPEDWVREARSFEKVVYENVWPGIDLHYYFKNGNLKYDVVVGEQADPGLISFFIEGHSSFEIEEDKLEIFITKDASISDSDLIAYYEDGTPETVQFKKTGDSTYGFKVDKVDGKKLTIDPMVFSRSTFLGGSGGETATDLAVDDEGNITILGQTSSNDFPNTTGAFQNSYAGGLDIVITKMDANATNLIFSTYIGDYAGDYPNALDVDDNGDIYVTGYTWSWYFPTTNGSFQDEDPSGTYPDAFVFKLSSSGSDLVYSTYVGGTQSDRADDIKVVNGYAYVVGNTHSYDFPTVSQPVNNAHGTVFFFILKQDGSNLTHSLFWGGWSNEFGYSMVIDSNGDVVVGGVTFSLDFPTTSGAYQENCSDIGNGFLLKYRPSTSTMIFSTYIGGSVGDTIYSVDVDSSSNVYFSGTTSNPGTSGKPFPTTSGAYDNTINGSRDIFIGKMSSDGSNLIYSTFLGSEGDEDVGGVDLDSQGNVYFTGAIDSDVNFSVTPDAFDDTYNQEGDTLFVVLKADWTNLLYCTYLGGNASDSGAACLLSGTDEILILGSTGSSDFPVTSGSYQIENKGYGDMFLTFFSIGNYIFLHEGWNLISVPLVPLNQNLKADLSSISGHYDAVQWYDAYAGSWQHTRLSKPSHMNTLENIDHTKGFWVHITEPGGVLFEYTGNPPGFTSSIPLYTGWNAVGYPASGNMRRDMALNGLAFGVHVDSIWYFDAFNRTWREMYSSDYFVLGRGYWIHATQDCVWMVP